MSISSDEPHADKPHSDAEAGGWRNEVLAALAEYDKLAGEFYDETFLEVSQSVQAAGAAGKADICVLATWKRSAQGRWLGLLLKHSERDVRSITANAFAAADEEKNAAVAARAGRSVLAELPGFGQGDAIASAVLCAYDPIRFGVYDRRSHAALTSLGFRLDNKSGRYARYIRILTDMREGLAALGRHVSAREVDQALYCIGGRGTQG